MSDPLWQRQICTASRQGLLATQGEPLKPQVFGKQNSRRGEDFPLNGTDSLGQGSPLPDPGPRPGSFFFSRDSRLCERCKRRIKRRIRPRGLAWNGSLVLQAPWLGASRPPNWFGDGGLATYCLVGIPLFSTGLSLALALASGLAAAATAGGAVMDGWVVD